MTRLAIVTFIWILFYSYWMFAAIGVKRNIRTEGRLERLVIRVMVFAAIVLMFRVPVVRQAVGHFRKAHTGQATETVGFVVCLCGFALAIWARVNLGRNWGNPMTLKEGHELVTTGPYQFIRHPIYTGILIAMLGSTLVAPIWVVPFVCVIGYFVYSARTEEHIMDRKFPIEYPEYRKRTKALVPFVW